MTETTCSTRLIDTWISDTVRVKARACSDRPWAYTRSPTAVATMRPEPATTLVPASS